MDKREAGETRGSPQVFYGIFGNSCQLPQATSIGDLKTLRVFVKGHCRRTPKTGGFALFVMNNKNNNTSTLKMTGGTSEVRSDKDIPKISKR